MVSESTDVQHPQGGTVVKEWQGTTIGNGKVGRNPMILVEKEGGASFTSAQFITTFTRFPLGGGETSKSMDIAQQPGNTQSLRKEPSLVRGDVRLLERLRKLRLSCASFSFPDVDFG